MIAHLEGRLLVKSPDHLVVDVSGVGYLVQVPLSTFYQLPEQGRTASLHIHTQVREDALNLFGFHTLSEKEMFLHLIAITGVGPKLALAILSGISADDLRQVVVVQDRTRLKKIPGVGNKTADRILLELRDKLQLPSADDSQNLPTAAAGDDDFADAFSALINLGYRPAEAQKALKQAAGEIDSEPPRLEQLLKEALRVLA